MKKRISVDIDGILTDYPMCWINYVNLELNTRFESREEIKKEIGDGKYKFLKKKYRKSDYKANLPVNQEFKSLLKEFKKNNYEIIIFSSRPFNDKQYSELYSMTENWLIKNHIPFDFLFYKAYNQDVLKNIPKMLYHIEDEIKYAELIANKGVQVFLYSSQNGNEKYLPKINNIVLFDSIEKILLK